MKGRKQYEDENEWRRIGCNHGERRRHRKKFSWLQN